VTYVFFFDRDGLAFFLYLGNKSPTPLINVPAMDSDGLDYQKAIIWFKCPGAEYANGSGTKWSIGGSMHG
jgi:hypothetical protein